MWELLKKHVLVFEVKDFHPITGFFAPVYWGLGAGFVGAVLFPGPFSKLLALLVLFLFRPIVNMLKSESPQPPSSILERSASQPNQPPAECANPNEHPIRIASSLQEEVKCANVSSIPELSESQPTKNPVEVSSATQGMAGKVSDIAQSLKPNHAIVATLIICAILGAFPPWAGVNSFGPKILVGHSFFMSPPKVQKEFDGFIIHYEGLFISWAIVGLLGVAAYVYLRGRQRG